MILGCKHQKYLHCLATSLEYSETQSIYEQLCKCKEQDLFLRWLPEDFHSSLNHKTEATHFSRVPLRFCCCKQGQSTASGKSDLQYKSEQNQDFLHGVRVSINSFPKWLVCGSESQTFCLLVQPTVPLRNIIRVVKNYVKSSLWQAWS